MNLENQETEGVQNLPKNMLANPFEVETTITENANEKKLRKTKKSNRRRRRKRKGGIFSFIDKFTNINLSFREKVSIWITSVIIAEYLWFNSSLWCYQAPISSLCFMKANLGFNGSLLILFYTIIHFFLFINAALEQKGKTKTVGIIIPTLSLTWRLAYLKVIKEYNYIDGINFMALQICFCCLLLIFAFYSTTFYLVLRKDKTAFMVWTTFVSLILFAFYYRRVFHSCDALQTSLDPRIKYSNKGSECRWERGKVCWHFTIEGLFTPLFWGRTDCSAFRTNLTLHKEMYQKTVF